MSILFLGTLCIGPSGLLFSFGRGVAVHVDDYAYEQGRPWAKL